MSFVVAYALAGAGTLLVVLWVMLYLRYSSQYDVMIAAIDKKQFFLPEIFFIGFGFMDMFKVNLKTEAGRKKEKKIAEIYGEKYAEYYHNCIVGGQITYALTVAPLGLFIGAMTNDMTFAILVVAAAAALIVYLDIEVSSAVERKHDEILSDYPEILSKLTLLVNAGMVIREAWTKVAYRRDGLYTFDIDVTDKAGNTSADFTEQTFYVDTTAPTLEITGVADRSANNGDIIPVVSYSDTNYDDAQVNITLTGAMRKGVALDGSYADQHNGKVFTFKNFAKEKEVDDIYTLAATLTDKAGNTTEKTILFSANRFGSTYALSAATDQLNGSYVQTPQDVVVTETNPDALQNIRITLFKNNQTIILQEGTDYRIEVRGGNGQWYEYIYTVLAKNFADDGVYRLTFYSEDAAGNIAENTLDTKKQEIGFGVDKTKPNMVVTNLESDTTYPLENLTVSLSAGDNLLLQSVVVYLDDYSKAYKTWTAEEVAAIVADQGEFTFDIPGDSTGAHQVKIVCTDAAGNEQTEEITNFYVTTNLFVRYYNNKPLFFGSIAAVVVIAGVVIALAAGKKKKNDKEK